MPTGDVLYADDQREHAEIRFDGEALDPPIGLSLMLNKPVGVTCSTKDVGRLVYDLLPERFRLRNPALSTVGRLDRETSGLLLLTDDGALLHRIISPKIGGGQGLRSRPWPKTCAATRSRCSPAARLMLESEKTPLLPAELEILEPRRAA